MDDNLKCRDAIKQNDIPTIEMLLSSGRVRMNEKDDTGTTLLHWACLKNSVECARLLLQHGADVNVGTLPEVPLAFAACRGNIELAKLLLEYGADINSLNHHGLTPLSVAVKFRQMNFCVFLLENGADPNQPLYDAVIQKNLELCTLLIHRGADVNRICSNGLTLREIARSIGFVEFMEITS